VSYNASSTAGSNWGGNNYLLRDRVARILGPIVKYASGKKQGQLVGPDIEAWLQADKYQGSKGIAAQWATLHSGLAANWVKADALHADYVTKWKDSHPQEVAAWVKANNNTEPTPDALAGVFFESYSTEHPGTFPVATETKSADGKAEKAVQPAKEATEIQSIFFDMWRQDHPTVDLAQVPADMVTASGAGLDPDITLANALYQLDRVAAKRAGDARLPEDKVRQAIERMLKAKAVAPLNGLAGALLVNVLEANLALTGTVDGVASAK
jgi:K+-transporting ATPase ATPase C chain